MPPRIELKQTNKRVIYLGKTYNVTRTGQFQTFAQIAKHLKVSKELLTQYISNDTTRSIVKPNGEITTFNLRDAKPLILREFNIRRITNKSLMPLNDNIITRGGEEILTISNLLPNNTNIQVAIKYTVDLVYSEAPVRRSNVIRSTLITNINIADVILTHARNTYNIPTQRITIIDYEILKNNLDGNKMTLINMRLRDVKALKISNVYYDVIDNIKGHCIHDYMLSIYKKAYSIKVLDKLHTTNDIYEFCKSKSIKMIAYNISGDVIISNIPTIRSARTKLIFIAYNNHLYPIKNDYLNKVSYKSYNKLELLDDINTKLLEIISNGNIVGNVVLNDCKEIISFIDDNIKYICNNEYTECLQILVKFGLQDKMYDNIKLKNICDIVSGLYITDNINSVILNHDKFRKEGFVYNNDNLQGEFITLDFNKHYPTCLRDLDYLIKCDITCDDIQDNVLLDEDEYLYIAKPEKSSLLIPNTNIYTGYHLKYCRDEGLVFTILEKLKTTKTPNYYNKFINDMFIKLDINIFKSSVNVMIGKFENAINTSTTIFKQFANNEEITTLSDDYYIHNITDNVNMVYSINTNVNIYSKKPIAIQVKDLSRVKLYKLMKSLNLQTKDIKSINTDAICFIKPDKFKLDKSLIGSGLGQLKVIENKTINDNFNYDDNDITFIDTNDNNNVLGLCYAGCGKSHKIINSIVPSLTDYKILTPSHSSIIEYRNLKLNCDVIQIYSLTKVNMNNDTIIIDELGMVGKFDLHNIIKWWYEGKKLIAYGDLQQLKPVKSDGIMSSIFKKSLFSKVDNLETNFRNNFSKLFYDDIINGVVNCVDVVKFYNDINSNNVISHTNKTCNKYNSIISNKLNIQSKFDVGAVVICNTNELRNLDLYNKMLFTIKESNDIYVILNNGVKITREMMDKKEGNKLYFSLGYARTLYSYQGACVKSYYHPEDDNEFIDSRYAYTLISRLSGVFKPFNNNVEYVN